MAIGIAGVVFGAWLLTDLIAARPQLVVTDVVFVVVSCYAAVSAAVTARRARGRSRSAWWWLTAGLVGWVLGEVVWTYYEVVLWQDPFPSLADIAYLALPLCTCAAVVQLPYGSAGQSRARLLLDGVLVASTLFLLVWVLVLRGVYETSPQDRFELAVSLVYPVLDIAMVTVLVLVLARATGGQRLAMALLTAAAVFMTAADTSYAYLTAHDDYASGRPTDVLWLASLLGYAAAATVARHVPASDGESAQVPPSASLWLPYLPMLLGGTATAVTMLPNPVLTAASLAIVAVCARQALAAWENRRLLSMIAGQALLDPLTGVANRALLHDRLAHALALRQRDNREVAVVSLDLNDFKLVNDSLGHPAGDALLVDVARRLQRCVRPGDTVARLGGDEFTVLLEGEADEIHLVAERIVEAFGAPFVVDGHDLLVRPSVGMALADAGAGEAPAEELPKRADIAMYAAKRARSSGLFTFSPEMALGEAETAALRRLPVSRTVGDAVAAVQLLGELRCAVDGAELDVVYQPQFDLGSGRIVGAEALVRWPHRERGVLQPHDFLPLVRRHGLMRPVTELVVAKALDAAAGWQRRGTPLPIAVNLFAPFLRDSTLPDRLTDELLSRGLPAESLTVEITEDLVLENLNRTRSVLRRLRERGVRVSIDDFGTGYSALSYLGDLPVDEIKLDRHFIAPALDDARASAVLRAVIDLAGTLGITTVGEGVEDAATADRLLDLGCDIGQGFHFGRPCGHTAITALLTSAAGPSPLR